jgi:hypothetical protein
VAAQLLAAVDGRLTEVRIERLVDETFYAQVVVGTQSAVKIVPRDPAVGRYLALQPHVSADRRASGLLASAETIHGSVGG